MCQQQLRTFTNVHIPCFDAVDTISAIICLFFICLYFCDKHHSFILTSSVTSCACHSFMKRFLRVHSTICYIPQYLLFSIRFDYRIFKYHGFVLQTGDLLFCHTICDHLSTCVHVLQLNFHYAVIMVTNRLMA